MKRVMLVAILATLSQFAVAQAAKKGPYLGEAPPGVEAKLFAPGLISTELEELTSVFSPDGKEFFYTRAMAKVDEKNKDPNLDMFYLREGKDGWGKAIPFPANGPSFDMDMEYSQDGKRLWWVGTQMVNGEMQKGIKLYYSDRQGDSWGPAKQGPEAINAFNPVLYPTVTAKAFYFPSRADDTLGGLDLYRSELKDGVYQKPVNVGAPVNSKDSESDTYVSADESVMILSSGRPGGQGESDLYVSFKGADGKWGEPKNLGPKVNTNKSEYCPKLTPDGKYLFFTSKRSGEGDIYWVDAKVVYSLR